MTSKLIDEQPNLFHYILIYATLAFILMGQGCIHQRIANLESVYAQELDHDNN